MKDILAKIFGKSDKAPWLSKTMLTAILMEGIAVYGKLNPQSFLSKIGQAEVLAIVGIIMGALRIVSGGKITIADK